MRYIWAVLTMAFILAALDTVHAALATSFALILLTVWLTRQFARSLRAARR